MTIEVFGFDLNYSVLPTPFVFIAAALAILLRIRSRESHWTLLLIALIFAVVAYSLQSLDYKLQIETWYNMTIRFNVLLGANFLSLIHNILFLVWLLVHLRRTFLATTSESASGN